MSDSIYDYEVERLNGERTTLEAGRGQVMLIVNTASKCGFTPQFAGLEQLHEDYAGKGLLILGFPCNQFGGQEPGDAEEIGEFCRLNYGVTFPMHAKIEVNGGSSHPLFEHLKSEAPGLLGTTAVKWNFTKFLVDRSGRVVERFSPSTPPEKIRARVEALLEEPPPA